MNHEVPAANRTAAVCTRSSSFQFRHILHDLLAKGLAELRPRRFLPGSSCTCDCTWGVKLIVEPVASLSPLHLRSRRGFDRRVAQLPWLQPVTWTSAHAAASEMGWSQTGSAFHVPWPNCMEANGTFGTASIRRNTSTAKQTTFSFSHRQWIGARRKDSTWCFLSATRFQVSRGGHRRELRTHRSSSEDVPRSRSEIRRRCAWKKKAELLAGAKGFRPTKLDHEAFGLGMVEALMSGHARDL